MLTRNGPPRQTASPGAALPRARRLARDVRRARRRAAVGSGVEACAAPRGRARCSSPCSSPACPDLADSIPDGPPAPHGAPPRLAVADHGVRRHRALGLALAAGAASSSTPTCRSRTLTGHYLAGQFVGNVLPSTIGGDVVRVTRCSKTVDSTTDRVRVGRARTAQRHDRVAAARGDRLRAPAVARSTSTHAWVALLVAAASPSARSGSSSFAAGHPGLGGRFASNENWTRFIGAVFQGVDRARHEPRQMLRVLGTALVYQLSIVLSYLLIFHALDLPVLDRGGDRVHSRGVDAPGDSRSRSTASASARARSCCSVTGFGVASAVGRCRRSALVRIARAREHARRADHRGRAPRADAATLRAADTACTTRSRPRDGAATASRAEGRSATPRRSRCSTGGSRSSRSSASTACTPRSGTRTAAIRSTRSTTPGTSSRIEHHLGIFHEETIQRWALHFKPLIITANYIYGSLHFIVTIGSRCGCSAVQRRLSALSQHAGGHDRARAHRLHGLPADAAPAARHATACTSGFVDTLRRYPTPGRSTPGRPRASRTSSRRCPACTSRGRPGARWRMVPRLKNARQRDPRRGVSRHHPDRDRRSPRTTTSSTRSAASLILSIGWSWSATASRGPAAARRSPRASEPYADCVTA